MDTEDTFSIEKDKFSGININTQKINFDTDADFETKLKASIARWKAEGIRGVWIKVAKEHSSLIPICVQAGFEFHHAQAGYVMMKTWLPTEEEDMLPAYASQYLGCAGFVVNDENQVLVIKEKYHSPAHRQWKLPGGHANAGEDISKAAQREVMEETGIEADFEAVLTFTHQHEYWHGCSDLYFVCLMRARTTLINACRQEIEECCWMDIDEYMNQPKISSGNRYIVHKYKEYILSARNGSLKPEPVRSYNKKSTNLIYSIHPLDGASKSVDLEHS